MEKEEIRISKWVIFACLAIFIFSTFFYAYMHQKSIPATEKMERKIHVKVNPGMGADQIAGVLSQKKIIDNEFFFRIMAKINGLDSKLRAGNYTFYPGTEYRQIIEDLTNGKTSDLWITVPEGYNIDQIAALLQEKDIVLAKVFQQEAENFRPFSYMERLPRVKYSAEGFLFPDTYELPEHASAQDVLQIMSQEFDARFNETMRQRAAELQLTIREVVILSSLVEKEAQVDEDRPIIAQVFINRLRAQMPLQSCATIQYILGTPKAELSVADTEIVSPYNTYQNMGLPPGPIANPGIASIEAVLYSKPTEYLYFVANKDGKHHFSRTYEEHLQAIREVQ